MPAVLDEAFNSPYKGLTQYINSVRDSSNTDSLHNPQYEQASVQSRPEASVQSRPEASVQGRPEVSVQSRPEVSVPTLKQNIERYHNCQNLITEMMSCQICRNQLRNIMKEDYKEQGGGMPWSPIRASASTSTSSSTSTSTSTISNFVFGIAVLFLVDRIVKIKS